MSLSFNRHQEIVALNKARRLVRRDAIKWNTTPDEKWIEKHAHQIRDNRTPCSCDKCCNPRRSAWNRGRRKLTMQEQKANLTLKEKDV